MYIDKSVITWPFQVGQRPLAQLWYNTYMRIVTWNVNGLRAIMRKGFEEIFAALAADFFLIQETKTNKILPLAFFDYREAWCLGERPGYSGTLTLIRQSQEAQELTPPDLLAAEGRTVALELPEFYLINTYFPNGGQGPVRLHYKMDFYAAYLNWVKELAGYKPVLFAGDVNTAHQEIDLARPRENATHTGFLPEERAWLDEVTASGFVDVWRAHHPGEVGYSWWDYKTRARERDVGWRIDYFWASPALLPAVTACEIKKEIMGSDHAPIVLDLDTARLH